MKLRGKMQLLIGSVVTIMLLIVGIISAQINFTSNMSSVKNSIKTSSVLAGSEISANLDNYLKMVSVSGEDVTLSSSTETNEAKADRINELAEEYGFTSGNILDKNGVSLKDGTDFGDREYVKQALAGNANISDINLSKLTNKYGFSVAAPVKNHESGEILGVVYYRMDIDFMEEITQSINISDNSYAYIVDGTGAVIVHEDSSLITTANILEQTGELGVIGEKAISGEQGDGTYTYNGEKIICGYAPIANTNGWSIIIAAPISDFSSSIYNTVIDIIVVVIVLVIISAILAGILAGTITKKIVVVKDTLEKLAEGDFSSEIKEDSGKSELSVLINSTYSLKKTLTGIIGDSNKILGAMASYNLTSKDMKNYPGEFNTIAESVNHINAILKSLIAEVKESANCVGVGAKELADAAESLSQGTVAQANSIMTVAHDVEDIAMRIANSSENGDKVNAKLGQLDGEINTGNEEMTVLLTVVKEVESMSNDIQKIVGTIDSIAFQTNILALNAAVEAASAGEHGKGFAVVADEIGNLANRCSESSKQTEELVSKCIEKIKKAKTCADSTFDCLSGIVKNSNEISEAFDKINKDTTEQATRSANVQREVNTISDIIQNNTAAAEETAAASETLSEQAMNLNELILQFRL